jgi:anti-sigma B factor antagonist
MEFYFSEVEKDVLVLRADGGLNSENAEEFVDNLERIIDVGIRRIIVDCARLESVNSYGLAVLIRLHKRLKRKGGDVRLASVRGLVIKVLEITRLDHLFAIYPDVSRARLSFRPIDAGLECLATAV